MALSRVTLRHQLLLSFSLASLLGCGDDSEGSGGAGGEGATGGATVSAGGGGAGGTSACQTEVGDLTLPGAPLCAESAAFGDIYLDDSGVPLARAILVTQDNDTCQWAENVEENEDAIDVNFLKVDVYGPVPGTCAVQVDHGEPTPPFSQCVAVVRMRRLAAGEKQDVQAISGSVTVTALDDTTIVTSGSVRFPDEPEYEGSCAGMGTGQMPETTCTCTSASGDERQCTAQGMGGGCCNEGKAEGRAIEWAASAPKCPLLCACLSSVQSCPCFQ